jgi:hypothetical protein
MQMSKDEHILNCQLAKLLSFDLEDVADVFEPLLDFDSEEDLLEYMCALLGDENDEVVEFVKNIMRFQKGQAIISPALDGAVASKIEPEATSIKSPAVATEKAPAPQLSQTSRKLEEKMRREQQLREQRQREKEELNRKRNIKEEEDRQKQLFEQQRRAEEQAMLEFKRKHEEEKQKELELASSMAKMQVDNEAKKERISKKPEPTKPTPPPKGKAEVVCGCFGTVHKPLTNCLHCGRISCKKEGYGYCPFCSNLIEKVVVTAEAGKNFDKATLHIERLLKFDRESTKRTQIYDDQADYFQNSSSTWLTADEQQDAQLKEESRRIDLHTIKKHTLNIQF